MSLRSFLLLPILAASLALANGPKPDADLSIGATYPVSADRQTVANWKLHSPKGSPQLLSDRIILTPPAPGHQRTGIWAERPVPYDDWTVDLSFRAHGQERPGGSITLWYTSKKTDTETVYDSRGWDGLAVVVDTQESGKGSIRAYLNDGKKDYANEKRPASLAFGHCDVMYRNRGVISKLTLSVGSGIVKVELDGRPCFESKKTRLPKGYYLGVTASTLDPPDSFELFSLITTSSQPLIKSPRDAHAEAGDPHARERLDQPIRGQRAETHGQENKAKEAKGSSVLNHPDEPPSWEYKPEPGEEDHDATYYKTPTEQFKDLHDRLQSMTHHLAQMQYQGRMTWEMVDNVMKKQEEVLRKQEEMIKHVKESMAGGRSDSGRNHEFEQIKTQLQSLELLTIEVANAITHKDYSRDFDRLRQQLEQNQRHVVENVHQRIQHVVKSHTPKVGMAITIMIMVQVALAAAYVFYKKRRNSSPKKYL